MLAEYLPVIFLFFVGVASGALLIVFSHWAGPKMSRRPAHDSPYESGIVPTGDTRRRFRVAFYIVAMLFILFDLEVVFILPWAVMSQRLGGFALLAMLQFLLILTIGLVYEWKKGALEWD